MNYKISVVLILIALVASVLLSGCLEKVTTKEYKVIQVTGDSKEYHIIYESIIDNNSYTSILNMNPRDDIIIYSNKTRLVDECYNSVGRCWRLSLNKSDVIN